jgi:hypothetical protein
VRIGQAHVVDIVLGKGAADGQDRVAFFELPHGGGRRQGVDDLAGRAGHFGKLQQVRRDEHGAVFADAGALVAGQLGLNNNSILIEIHPANPAIIAGDQVEVAVLVR